MTIENRDIRQREILPPALLATLAVTVIGVGAIGRQVALMLAAMGIPKLQIIDHDTVGPENLASQGYLEDDLNQLKVNALHDTLYLVNSEIDVEATPDKYSPQHRVHKIVMSCVDSMDARKQIYEHTQEGRHLFIDGRMAAMTARVLTDNGSHDFNYEATLFSQAEAYVGGCTSQSTIFCANVAAGLMVNQLVLAVRSLPLEHDFQLNLLSMDMVFHGAAKALERELAAV